MTYWLISGVDQRVSEFEEDLITCKFLEELDPDHSLKVEKKFRKLERPLEVVFVHLFVCVHRAWWEGGRQQLIRDTNNVCNGAEVKGTWPIWETMRVHIWDDVLCVMNGGIQH